MGHEVVLNLSTTIPDTIYKSLEPDTKTTQKNVKIELEKTENMVTIRIRAPTLAVLRGVVNTYLRLFRTAQEFGGDNTK